MFLVLPCFLKLAAALHTQPHFLSHQYDTAMLGVPVDFLAVWAVRQRARRWLWFRRFTSPHDTPPMQQLRGNTDIKKTRKSDAK
jgi:hypothetical protein